MNATAPRPQATPHEGQSPTARQAEELRREGNPEVVQFIQGLPDGPVPFHYPAVELLQEL